MLKSKNVGLCLICALSVASCSTTAATSQPPHASSTANFSALQVQCEAFVRPTPTAKFGSLGRIRMVGRGDETKQSEHFTFRMAMWNDRYEGSGLTISVSDRASGKPIEQTLFQAPNDFRTAGNGAAGRFTGLRYVWSPDSREELQYSCALAGK